MPPGAGPGKGFRAQGHGQTRHIGCSAEAASCDETFRFSIESDGTLRLTGRTCGLVDVEETMPPRNQEQQVTAGERPAEIAAAAPDAKLKAAEAQPKAAEAQPKQREFRPDIQGLRALAVGMVVFYHLYPS